MTRLHPRAARAQTSPSRISAAHIAVALAVLWLTLGASQLTAAASLTELSGIAPGYYISSERNNSSAPDFDGDGLADIVLLGSTNYSDVMQVVGFRAGLGWGTRQVIVPEQPEDIYGGAPNFATWIDADGAHLLYARGDLVHVYTGWPLELERTFRLASGSQLSDVKVADVNNDGVFEMIASIKYSQSGLVAYSLNTGAQLWSAGVQTSYETRIHVGQVDGDPALEIFLAGSPGKIVDGATHAIEWQYKDGFGYLMEHGRFGGSSNGFASLDYRLLMFQSQPWSPLWEIDNLYATSSTVADIDDDDIDELIIVSDGNPHGVRIVDVQTQSISNSFAEDSVRSVVAADFDGDDRIEIGMELDYGFPTFQASRFRVIDAITGTDEYSMPIIAPGPYVVGGFVPGTSSEDLVFGAGSTTYHPGVISRVDPATGEFRWRISGEDSTVNMNQVRELLTTSMAGHAEPIVLVSGSSFLNYNGQIAALDANTGTLLWRISGSEGNFPDSAYASGIAAIDLNDDLLTDALLVCTSESRLRLFDTTDQSEIWSSVTMSSGCRGAMQLNSGGRKQLVAVLVGGLRAYDAQTHLLSWSLPFPDGLVDATYLAHGVTGPELALFDSYGIAFHDVESRILLREVTFASQFPVHAVAQPEGASIHELVVAINERLHVVDGVSGEIRAISGPLGLSAGQGNHLAVRENSDGSATIGVGSEVAVFTYRLDGLSDEIFVNGFDLATP